MTDNSDTRKPKRNWKKTFIEMLQNTSNVRVSCEVAKISRDTAYKHYKTDAKFAARWDEALESACDILEARAWERSKTSDQLLMFLLRAHRPNKYAERIKNEVSGEIGIKTYVGISPDEWENAAE